MTGDPEDIISFFRAELQDETSANRVENIRRVKWIAAALGPEETRTSLLPLLQEFLEFSNHDESLYCLAEQLAELPPYLGTPSDNLNLLFPLLEALAIQEETCVREQAIESIASILRSADQQNPKLATHVVLPIIDRLAAAEWFTSRIAACHLIPHVYPRIAPPHQNYLNQLFIKLVNSDSPMVRRAALATMKSYIQAVSLDDIPSIWAVYKECWKDDNDTLRATILGACPEMGRKLLARPKEADFDGVEAIQDIATFISAAAKDRSWKCRLATSKLFPEILDTYTPVLSSDFLAPLYADLIRDPEELVRTSAADQLVEVSSRFPPEVLSIYIVPSLQTLAIDPCNAVRTSLGNALGAIAKILGQKEASKDLLSLIIELLKDRHPGARLSTLSNVADICRVLQENDQSEALLSQIQTLVLDPQWRIRRSLIIQISILAEQLSADKWSQTLEPIFLSSLTDPVLAVREAVFSNIPAVTNTLGAQWALKTLLPDLLDKYSNPSVPFCPPQTAIDEQHSPSPKPVSYLTRASVLAAGEYISEVLHPDVIVKQLMPTVKTALTDPVPNVRFAASRLLIRMVENGSLEKESIDPEIFALLTRQTQDEDIDVQFFARAAASVLCS